MAIYLGKAEALDHLLQDANRVCTKFSSLICPPKRCQCELQAEVLKVSGQTAGLICIPVSDNIEIVIVFSPLKETCATTEADSAPSTEVIF